MQLTHLDLSKNQIVDLPENFGNLVKLKSLDLYANQITRLPLRYAGHLCSQAYTQVHRLTLRHNWLTLG